MGGFTKFYDEMLDSTVWELTDSARLVWVTLLLLSDPDGNVLCTEQALARRARVRPALTRAALEIFMSPDPKSKNRAHDGRRLIPLPGRGWFIVSYRDYRERDLKRTRGRKEVVATGGDSSQSVATRTTDFSTEVVSAPSDSLSGAQKQKQKQKQIQTGTADGVRSMSARAETSSSPSIETTSPRSETGSSPNVSATTTETPDASPYGPFDPVRSWSLTREMWGNAGPRADEKDLTTARKAFGKHINASNWLDFAQRLDWAVTASLKLRNRDRLGVLYTFITSRWKEQEAPFDPATPTASTPTEDAPPLCY